MGSRVAPGCQGPASHTSLPLPVARREARSSQRRLAGGGAGPVALIFLSEEAQDTGTSGF